MSGERKKDIIDVRAGLSERTRAALAGAIRPKKQADRPKLPRADPAEPTPERMRHSEFVQAPVYDILPGGRRTMIGKAWQVRPRFLSIEGLSPAQLRALAIYRKAFDESERSEVKSQLNVGTGGRSTLSGADLAIARLEGIAFADLALQRIEARVKNELAVLRAVALFDRDFTEVAIELFGGREIQKIDARRKPAVTRNIVVPKSGKHRTEARDRFMRALVDLVAAVSAPKVVAAPAAEFLTGAIVPIGVDEQFLDERGYMRPWEEVRDIILAAIQTVATCDPDGGAS
ncbi:hypothetical protein [Sphingomonas montanisoli]|uniref:Uncharacterized protein n=1 Tax=Sphingomonas montanisoli TaxID=2606412 RepID=A0A5D9CEL9_9SPHN|nr:hypothetical protein [Sphingomonas montanisoli]TZG28585.1 hypothetical protein FYJ91_00035 [Sphingomonas montanisoli]